MTAAPWRPGAPFWAIVLVLLLVLLAVVVAAQSWADPFVWPQVTRCEVVQPEDLDADR
jgi:hypothetical protein